MRSVCSRELQASSNLTAEQQTILLASLAKIVHQTFEPYLGDELSDYVWLMEKLWPEWRRPVESGAGKTIQILPACSIARVSNLPKPS